jgi:hypothetical protein
MVVVGFSEIEHGDLYRVKFGLRFVGHGAGAGAGVAVVSLGKVIFSVVLTISWKVGSGRSALRNGRNCAGIA